MNEGAATAAARACLEASPDHASYDLENPFAFGPGAKGGWVVRFDKLAPQGAVGIEIELDRSGRCAVR